MYKCLKIVFKIFYYFNWVHFYLLFVFYILLDRFSKFTSRLKAFVFWFSNSWQRFYYSFVHIEISSYQLFNWPSTAVVHTLNHSLIIWQMICIAMWKMFINELHLIGWCRAFFFISQTKKISYCHYYLKLLSCLVGRLPLLKIFVSFFYSL